MPAIPCEEAVTSEAIIIDCLNQISSNNTPLSLTLRETDDGGVYNSKIHSLNLAKRQIVLNQILPSDWREKITIDTKLEIKSTMNMGSIRFLGLLSPLDDSENSPYCKLTLPRKIYRMQLRDYYRVSLAKIHSSVILHDSETSLIKGSCRDISMSGAMVALPKDSNQVEVGQTLSSCCLSIEDILELQFRGRIRSLHKRDTDTLAGIQFLDLSPAQLKPISAALNKIERKNITA